ncbi:hypothetical protein B0H13DRAFT_1892881 [Mycena leptocephala]|nr:hypothetical protein B0H13DRAFT_1892881 [Mycena leptocephala]
MAKDEEPRNLQFLRNLAKVQQRFKQDATESESSERTSGNQLISEKRPGRGTRWWWNEPMKASTFASMLVTTGKEIPQQEEKIWLSHKNRSVARQMRTSSNLKDGSEPALPKRTRNSWELYMARDQRLRLTFEVISLEVQISMDLS